MNLTLLIDQGEDVQGQRWQAGHEKFQDLESALEQTTEQALVLLGPPGSGKSTLLRNFQREASLEAQRAHPNSHRARYTFFIQLSEFKPDRVDDSPPLPEDWLAERWSKLAPELPELETLLGQGRMTLLLDALNEIPVAGREAINSWKDFLAKLAQKPDGNRVLFSCRSLDYSASLSTCELPVPQLRIEPLSDLQVQEFVENYASDHAEIIWTNLKDSKHLDLFRSPYYLKMLIDQSTEGEIPEGRVGLFTGFVRRLLRKEVQGESALFQPDALLTELDIQRLIHARRWNSLSDLPDDGLLVAQLEQLA